MHSLKRNSFNDPPSSSLAVPPQDDQQAKSPPVNPAVDAALQSVSSVMLLSLPQINADKEVYTKGTRSISSIVLQKGAAITSIESVMQRYPLPPKKAAKKEEKKKEAVVI